MPHSCSGALRSPVPALRRRSPSEFIVRHRLRIAAALGVAVCVALFVVALRFDDGLPGAPLSSSGLPSTDAGAGFPRRAVDSSGQELWIGAAPQAIGSQALTIDHILFAITDPKRIVSVSPYAMDPGYSFVHEIAGQINLTQSSDLEAVLRSAPDLMLLAHGAKAGLEDVLRHASIPSFRVRTVFADFDQVSEAITAVGSVTGDEAAAELEIHRLRERVERAKRRRPPGARAPRVLPYSTYGSTLGRGSLFDHILTELGAVNVAAEQGIGQYANISGEQVAAWDPDWIVTAAAHGAAGQARDRLLADPGIAVTKAGRGGQILVVESRVFTAMSQHAIGLMEAIAAGLYEGGP